jgi:hypothetical protein
MYQITIYWLGLVRPVDKLSDRSSQSLDEVLCQIDKNMESMPQIKQPPIKFLFRYDLGQDEDKEQCSGISSVTDLIQ